eukprot:29873-Eustigmatos_ZCMA.PRE.1
MLCARERLHAYSLLGLFDGGHLVGEAPEQQRDHHRAPKLRHGVEHCVCPVADDGDGPCEGDRQLGRQPVGERIGMEKAAVG